MSINLQALQEAFFEEAADLLADLERHLLRLESEPEDTELLNSIFRCAHSIKGGSATFGLPEIAKFTHGLETLLDEVRNGRVGVTRELCDVLIRSLDHLTGLFRFARGQQAVPPADLALEESIAKLSNGIATTPPTGREDLPAEGYAPARYRVRFEPGPDVLRQGCDPLRLLRNLEEEVEVLAVDLDTSRLPSLEDLDPTECHLAWTLEVQTDQGEEAVRDVFEFVADDSVVEICPLEGAAVVDAAASKGPAAAAAVVDPSGRGDTGYLRVAASKLDALINLVGELVISQAMVNEVLQGFTMDRLPRLQESIAAMDRASRELQERVMSTRLIAVRQSFSRFPRLVRDLSAQTGKQIQLRLYGEDVEMDKNLVEGILDPVMHLVRNAIDHGLELPEERVAAGKSPAGELKLSARHEGGRVVIEISDDGRGLDRDRIFKKAVERGLVAEGETLSDDQVYSLIFQPGFSTASTVTDLSGRGVGMDIVRQAVAGMKGSLTLRTSPGKGTTFQLKLPLTMAILEGLLLRVGEEIYVAPLTGIVESLQPKREHLSRPAGEGEVVQVRDEYLPVVRLYERLHIAGAEMDPSAGILVLVEQEGRKVALLVDEVVGQSQVVIKSIEANYRQIEGVLGATILGNGQVALILDIAVLVGSRADRVAA